MLFRAGETVHMKVYARRHASSGILMPTNKETDGKLFLTHQGSDEEYEVNLSWDASGSGVADFAIPREAKQGIYLLQYRNSKTNMKVKTLAASA